VDPGELEAEANRIEALPDAEARMVAAHDWLKAVKAAEIRFSDIRHFAAVELRRVDRRKWKLEYIAERLGLPGSSPRANAEAIVRGRRALRRGRRPGAED
jgi:hypothetical protein